MPLSSRRTVLKMLGVSAAYTAVSCTHLGKSAQLAQKKLEEGFGRDVADYLTRFGPIDRTDLLPGQFSGDNFNHLAHEFLWNKDGFMSSAVSEGKEETAEVVVIGGGMSGLFSAYLLRRYRPILLERAERLGGNAKGEGWNGIDYSIGAAYFVEHDEGSEIKKLFSELDLYSLCRQKDNEDPVMYKGQRYNRFWSGETDPKNSGQFKKLSTHFLDMFDGKNGLSLPAVPYYSDTDKALVTKLDKISFRKYLEKVAGGKLHPHIETAIEHYCWSTCGATMSELSAACALGQFVPEFGKVMVPPGGNSAVAERVSGRLVEALGRKNLRTSSLAIDVQVADGHVLVKYIQPDKKVRTIKCKTAIMACPKFVVGKVLNGIELERLQAIQKLRYSAYLVGNILLKTPVEKEFYDYYLLGTGHVDSRDPRAASDEQGITDVVLATYAKADKERAVITLYRSLPWVGGRADLFSPDSYSRYKEAFEKQIHAEILPALNIDASTIEDLRMTRWGHPMPVAAPGLITDGVIEQIRRPFKGRVFFVEQDNWMQPAIETCAEEALHWTKRAENLLA